MTLEEANLIVTMSLDYSFSGWKWVIETHKPFGKIIGYETYDNPEGALKELKEFLRYFTENVLKDGDSIRKYVEKHKPKKENE